MTNKLPKGMNTNILRSILHSDVKISNNCSKPTKYRKLVYFFCFFHTFNLKQRKFGPLDLKKQYDWTPNDIEISQRELKMFLDRYF
jgi:hypothetical protein